MKFLKSVVYSFVRLIGLEFFYLKTWIKIKSKYGQKSDYSIRLEAFYYDLLGLNRDLIFDIGANVGERTAVFLTLAKKVIAVEANTKLSKVLSSRFWNSNVIVINKGCSNSEKPLKLMIAESHLVSTFSFEFISSKKATNTSFSWNENQIIDCTTLDQLIQEHGIPDFCKIDVEGYEKFVIEGLNQKIGLISFELNYPRFLDDTKFAISKLESLGYDEFNFSYGESLEFVSSTWMNDKEIVLFLNQSSDSLPKSFYGDIYAR
jgi:FkbM family methyltransferase